MCGLLKDKQDCVRIIGVKQEGVNCLRKIFATIEGRLKDNEE